VIVGGLKHQVLLPQHRPKGEGEGEGTHRRTMCRMVKEGNIRVWINSDKEKGSRGGKNTGLNNGTNQLKAKSGTRGAEQVVERGGVQLSQKGRVPPGTCPERRQGRKSRIVGGQCND